MQRQRDKKAAKKFFRKLLKGWGMSRVIVTDKLRSYSAARTEIMPSVEHVQPKYQNNRAENSHQPTRLREKVMQGLSQRATRKDFYRPSESFPHISEREDASAYRAVMKLKFAVWEEAVCLS